MAILRALFQVTTDLISFFILFFRPWGYLAAENLFLRKQLSFYQERRVKPGRIDPASKLSLILLSKLFNWKEALVIVRPATLIRWHREAFRLFWRWKSKPGRPPIPADLRALIRQMARENPLWGEERIADELLLKLGIQISPRTVRKYMSKSPLTGKHLRRILREWVAHYNRGRPHSALGPGVPEPLEGVPVRLRPDKYRLDDGWRVDSAPVLGGLHHEYGLIPYAA